VGPEYERGAVSVVAVESAAEARSRESSEAATAKIAIGSVDISEIGIALPSHDPPLRTTPPGCALPDPIQGDRVYIL